MSKAPAYNVGAAGQARDEFHGTRLERAANPYQVEEPIADPVDDTGVALMVFLCAGALLMGWGLLIASLLFVVADYSRTAWLLTALGLALGHGVLAAICWRCANPFRAG
jgi:hypothetical protein